MARFGYLALLLGCILSSDSFAQNAGPFRWQQGQVLNYRVEHITSATDTMAGTKTESKTRLNLTKQWQVLSVEAEGVATLQLSLLALRLETTTPSGGVLLFDSADAEKSDPHLREELAKFVGQPLATLRLDSTGRVLEVKESKHGPASRFESELPFVLTFAREGLQAGQEWQRTYKITLDPPQGTGEKYDAAQRYVCKSVNSGLATIGMSTTLKTMPESMLDRVPLLQLQPEGEVVFDLNSGRMRSASLRIDKEVTGHQGEGSNYRFQSSYSEEWIEAK